MVSLRGLWFYLVSTHSHAQYTQADPPSNKNLAMLVCVMLQFQEVHLTCVLGRPDPVQFLQICPTGRHGATCK